MAHRIDRRHYADLYGPTVGDKVRLADTELFIEVENDHTAYGDESKFGGGKTFNINDSVSDNSPSVTVTVTSSLPK